MAGIKNSVLVAKNADYSQALGPNASSSEANGLITNGQVWMGTTALNAGGTHINVVTLTPGTGVTFTQTPTTFTIGLAGGGAAVEHLTGNTGGQLNPDVANNFNILGNNVAQNGFASFITGAGSTLSVISNGVAKWVVNPTAGVGTHTTITSALTTAVAGETIFITPGTYTENLTLKAGVDLTTFTGENSVPQVNIIGTLSASYSGTANVSNIRLQTNSTNIVSLTGANATVLNLNNCYLNCTNNTGISSTGSNAASNITLNNCNGNLGTTGIALFAVSNGSIVFNYLNITNTGLSTTASTLSSAATAQLSYSLLNFPITTSNTASLTFFYTAADTSATNTTTLVINGTGITNLIYSRLASGSATPLTIGSGATVNADNLTLNHGNANAVSGLGTLTYVNVTQLNTIGTLVPSTLNGKSIMTGSLSFNGGITTISALPVAQTVGGSGSTNFSGNLTLISSQTASNSATIDWTGLGSAYSIYVIEVINAVPATANQVFQLRVGTGGGPSYDSGTNYTAAMRVINTVALGLDNQSSSQTAIFLSDPGVAVGTGNISNTASDGGINTRVYFYSLPSTTQPKMLTFHSMYNAGTNVYVTAIGGGSWVTAGTAVSAIRMMFNSGNITSGVFRLYGVV